MGIEFSEIRGQRTPAVLHETNLSGARAGLPAVRKLVVLVGHPTTAGGSVAVETLQPVTSDADAATYWGSGSELHRMALAVFRQSTLLEVYGIGMTPPVGGSAATGKFTITGPASSAGYVRVRIVDTYVDLAIAKSDTAATICAALVAAIAAKTALPLAAAVDGTNNYECNLTAKYVGTHGNVITCKVIKCTAAGVTATAAGATLSGGTGTADPTATLAKLAGKRYHLIAVSHVDGTGLSALKAHMESMDSPAEQKYGMGIAGWRGTYAAGVTLADGVDSRRVQMAWCKSTPSMPCELAAAFCGQRAAETDPARPLNEVVLVGIAAPDQDDWPSGTEVENCLWNGVTPLRTDPDGKVRIVRSVTTEQDDETQLDHTTVEVSDYAATYIVDEVRRLHPRSKLRATGESTTNLLTPKGLKTIIYRCLKTMEAAVMVENVDANKNDIAAEVNASGSGRLDASYPCDVIQGAHVVAMRQNLIV